MCNLQKSKVFLEYKSSGEPGAQRVRKERHGKACLEQPGAGWRQGEAPGLQGPACPLPDRQGFCPPPGGAQQDLRTVWLLPLLVTNVPLGDFIDFFKKALFIFRERKGGRKRGRETSMCGCLSHAPYWGPGPQPRHVPWLGIEPATLWFTGRCSVR